MKTREQFIDYSKYLNAYYSDDQITFLKFRNDKNLSHAEKTLLNTRIYLREKEHDKCIDALENITVTDKFLSGERYLQLAATYLANGKFEESTKFGILAIRYYEECEDKLGLFKAMYNMSVAFNRIGMNSLAKYYISQCEKVSETTGQEAIILRMKASFYTLDCRFDKAISTLESILKISDQLSDFEVDANLVVLCETYVQNKNFDKAMRLAESMINSKKNRVKARIVFNYHLLKTILNNEKLPEKPEILYSVEEYSLKWDILESVQSGKREQYGVLWSDLSKNYSNYYGDLGVCIDKSEELNIFNQALQRMLIDDKVLKIDFSKVKGKKGKLLLELLANSSTPLRKEIIIEQVWGITYEPKYNARFYKLVERLKESTGVEIKNSNNAYFIAA